MALEESYEDLYGYAQAIKGDKAFADRILREAGKAPTVRSLSEARIATAVAAG